LLLDDDGQCKRKFVVYVISARQYSYPVSARQTVHLPSKITVWRRWRHR